jgi:hypothetical protein
MRRLVWISLGAAGGILAYRKAQELLDNAKEKGVIVTVSDTTAALKGMAQGASDQIARLREPTTQPQRITGTAAASVLSQPKQ